MLTCCPVVVRPPCVWPRGSLPSFLSFALQLALDVQVAVGSLLPYGSQPSRWGHPCGVEAGVVLDRNEGLFCFSFPSGLILRDGVTLLGRDCFRSHSRSEHRLFCVSLGVVQGLHGGLPNSGASWRWASAPIRPGGLIFCHYTTVLRDEVTLWAKCVGRFPLVHDRRLSLALSPISFRMGFGPLSEASLRALSLPASFLVILAVAASLRKFLALSSVLPYPMIRLHDHLHYT